METLEQYGIKDVTLGDRAGSSERLRGVFKAGSGSMDLYLGNVFRGILTDAKYNGKRIGRQSMYISGGTSIWLDEVSYD